MTRTQLSDTFALTPGALVAFIGAGGKTTLARSVADELAGSAHTVIVATTTKIWPPGDMPLVTAVEPERAVTGLRAALSESRLAAVGAAINLSGKVVGHNPGVLCQLAREKVADYVLCEADGAAGRPLKAHAEHEPMIPNCASIVVVVAGVDAIGHDFEQAVHRPQLFARHFQDKSSRLVAPEHVAIALAGAARFAPPDARVVFAMNKVDSQQDIVGAREAARLVQALAPGPPVVFVSRGYIVDVLESGGATPACSVST